jgi:hypothetical protein
MGAWGSGPFENDIALNWVSELAASTGLSAIEGALELPAASADYPKAPESSIAVAAAETVAAMKGKPPDNLPEEVVAFVKTASRPSQSLIDAASSAVARVLEKSELRELWAESDYYDSWRATLIDVRRRLGRLDEKENQ